MLHIWMGYSYVRHMNTFSLRRPTTADQVRSELEVCHTHGNTDKHTHQLKPSLSFAYRHVPPQTHTQK